MTKEQMEAIKEYYDSNCDKESGRPLDEYCVHSTLAIEKVLEILNVKIKGINA